MQLHVIDIYRHIIVFTSKFQDKEGTWRTMNQVHIQVMTRSENQDSSTNYALLRRALQIFKKANPEIENCIVRSDNAGKVVTFLYLSHFNVLVEMCTTNLCTIVVLLFVVQKTNVLFH